MPIRYPNLDREAKRKREDTRVAYGTGCTWWGSISEIGTRRDMGMPLPCCPFCQGMLFEVDSPETWWDNVRKYEEDGHPGYVEFMKWTEGKCFSSPGKAVAAYEVETGKTVRM